MNNNFAGNQFWYAKDDPWVLSYKGYEPEKNNYFETIFSQSNGYMGVRAYREESDQSSIHCREGYLAGVFAKLPPMARKMVGHDFPWDSQQMVSMPEIFSALIVLDNNELDLNLGEASEYEQSLDMRTGVLTRSMVWADEGGERKTKLRFTRFLSANNTHLAVQKIEIEPLNWSGTVSINWEYNITQDTFFRCGHKGKPNIACSLCTVKEVAAEGNTISGTVETEGSLHKIAYVSRVEGSSVNSEASSTGCLSQMTTANVRQGENSEWVRTTAVVTTRDEGVVVPSLTARNIVDNVSNSGFDVLASENESVWTERWLTSDVEIDGSVRDQVMVRFGIFSLLQIAPFHGDNLSIPARCYAFNRYNGHYFWDSEIFLLPYYQFCTPEVARNMLRFRCRTLPGARKNAALHGSEGALFPWQGSADSGEEQAPWGLYEFLWHQSADIIYAFDQYARATGDEAFMFEHGLEVLAETARFWLAKLKLEDDGKLHLPGTVGPDEAHEHGPDNGYTSLMVQRSLQVSSDWWQRAQNHGKGFAGEWIEKLQLSSNEVASWQAAAEQIHIPEVPGHSGVPLQDAFFLNKEPADISNMTLAEFWQCRQKKQVIKQADIVLAMYLLEDRFSQEEILRGYEYYEPKTVHISSLSYNTHSIVAAITGKSEEAYEYFHKAAGLDLDNLKNATADGLHAAALGAVWQMVIPGFMGMRVREDFISFKPVLPKAWKGMSFPIQYRDWILNFSVNQHQYQVEVTGAGQEGAVLVMDTERYTLTSDQIIQGQC